MIYLLIANETRISNVKRGHEGSCKKLTDLHVAVPVWNTWNIYMYAHFHWSSPSINLSYHLLKVFTVWIKEIFILNIGSQKNKTSCKKLLCVSMAAFAWNAFRPISVCSQTSQTIQPCCCYNRSTYWKILTWWLGKLSWWWFWK